MKMGRWTVKIKCQILQQQLRLAHQLKSFYLLFLLQLLAMIY